MWARRSRRGGFTLVEVLAAVLLMSIGLMAVVASVAAAREAQQRALYLSQGSQIAQNRLEGLRAGSFAGLAEGTSSVSHPSLPGGNQVTTTISRYPNPSEQNLYKVLVTVTWPEGRGIRSVRYESLIARH